MPSRRTTSSRLGATEIRINVYDLLPQGHISTLLWACGGSILHSGVVINGKEYAYGGHAKRGTSGVFWTRPGLEPPGGTFKCEILQGFSLLSAGEIDKIIRETSHKFQGPEWNLLSNNCNHFTSYLCKQLTGKPAPAWLNRAASVGVAIPCIVPRHWVTVPDAETADGELLEEDEEEDDEQSRMLKPKKQLLQRSSTDDYGLELEEFSEDDDEEDGEDGEDEEDNVDDNEDRDLQRRLQNKANSMSLNQSKGRPQPVSNEVPRPAS